MQGSSDRLCGGAEMASSTSTLLQETHHDASRLLHLQQNLRTFTCVHITNVARFMVLPAAFG